MRQVTFSAWGQVTFSACGQFTCTTQRHKRKQQWREERDARFLAGNTVTILSLCQLKTAILRFVVHCAGGDKVLSSYKNTTSNLKKHLESQHCSQTYRASPSRWCEAERRRSPTTQTTKAGLQCKTSKWERVEEVGRAVGLCCSGNAALKHGWLSCHNKPDPYYWQRWAASQ